MRAEDKQNYSKNKIYEIRLGSAALCPHLKSALFSVVEEHENGHLEGGDLQYVLTGVRARHLGSSHTHF